MSTKIRLWFTGVTLVATFGLVYTSVAFSEQGGGDLPKTVKNIAEAFKNGDGDGAKKQAVAAAKKIDDVADLMEMFKPKTGLNLQNLLKKPTVKNAQELGNLGAAMAELILAKTPAKDGTKGRTKKAWADFSEDMRAASLDLAKANNAKAVTAAATKIDNVCTACHNKFKD